MQGIYSVQIEKYAEGHFIKSFAKKYNNHWDVTLKAVVLLLERIDLLLQTTKAEIISDKEGVKIIKVEFTIAKSRESAKSSGNRCVVAWHKQDQSIFVLLVYGKTDVKGGHETVWWKSLVKENYPKYKDIV
ncbi:MAG: hypothetical protein RJA61_93 [Candidatus Parcubacteria bacterium]|jgi:hypothetical protein